VAQLCVAALDKGWAIAGEPRLDLSHACSPECINIYGLVSIWQADGEEGRVDTGYVYEMKDSTKAFDKIDYALNLTYIVISGLKYFYF
jgi:hypothetical protein